MQSTVGYILITTPLSKEKNPPDLRACHDWARCVSWKIESAARRNRDGCANVATAGHGELEEIAPGVQWHRLLHLPVTPEFYWEYHEY
jgi:hypothetical protein